MRLTPTLARSLAEQFSIPLEADFFTLSRFTVSRIIDAADSVRYRHTLFANGSRGRYFFAYLQRCANRKEI